MQTNTSLDSSVEDHPFLAKLHHHFYDFFKECAIHREFKPGQEIFHEGGDANRFYLIHSGKVSLETFVPGCGRVTIQSLGSTEALGWSWLFPPHHWHFTATASGPTELIELDARYLREKIEENPDFGIELVTRTAKILLQRLQGTRLQLIDLYSIRP
jgi:CRP/FNR family transcriptional regulator, cyclic AMP receptor protein